MRRAPGFTLIEVMLALVILTVVLLAMGGATAGYLQTVTVSDREAAALQLAHDRLDEVRLHPDYGGIDTLYNGVESNFPSLPGFTRTTVVAHYGGAGRPMDFKRVTVTVEGPGLVRPVSRTITVGAP